MSLIKRSVVHAERRERSVEGEDGLFPYSEVRMTDPTTPHQEKSVSTQSILEGISENPSRAALRANSSNSRRAGFLELPLMLDESRW